MRALWKRIVAFWRDGSPRREPGLMYVTFLPWWEENPYQIRLAEGLARGGVRVKDTGLTLRRLLYLWLGRDSIDVVHMHWPHGLYLHNYWRFPYVLFHLWCYRLLKNNVVWTVHELEFYETRHPWLDRLMVRFLMKISCRLIVHSEYSAQQVRQDFGYTRPIAVLKHPSYLGCYAQEVDRAAARRRLGVGKETFVYLFLGHIKPGKGVDQLVQAFRSIPDSGALLLVAGTPLDATVADAVRRSAAGDARIRLDLHWIADDEIQHYMSAADIVVFPFVRTHTSGSLMLAMSFGKPVIAPRMGSILEYVSGASGLLYDPNDRSGLVRALSHARACDLPAMGQAAQREVTMLDWNDFVLRHDDWYRLVYTPASRMPA